MSSSSWERTKAAAVFACNLQPFQTAHASAAVEALKPLVDVRSLALQGMLSEAELLIAAQARALLGWHALNRCCIRCGARLHAADGGWRRVCPACGLDAYPRTDPAVIMLITHGGRCLLGHEHRFPEKMYSTLAGFVEPGTISKTPSAARSRRRQASASVTCAMSPASPGRFRTR